MAPGGGRHVFKRESTIAGGLLTPDESFSTVNIVAPKREEIDLTFSDDIQERLPGIPFESHDGLPHQDEAYIRSLAEQQRRSASVSVRTSRPPENHINMPNSSIAQEEGLQVLVRDVNKLIESIEKLRRIGLKSVDAALPELVLVGDQSAGKSSLMGAIAEINLPKGQSMCTRCPTNIRTAPADRWSCTVSLQQEYAYVKKKGPGQPFPNWVARDGMVTLPFKTIDDKTELEEVLKWAQLALLNPSQDPQSFVPGTAGHAQRLGDDRSIEAKFSPNVIAVEISGPGLPPLSFYDLPGLFQNAEDHESHFLIKVFEDLTIKYIKHQNALIICTITMQNDPGLSRTKAIISKCHAEERCIGVLTMPDRLQASDAAHQDYTNILRGTTYKLPRGYYVTKQPGANSQLKGPEYHRLARQQEEEFFDSSELWGLGGVWWGFRARCGTATIQKYLSKEFAKQILKSLPNITENINAQMREVDHDLGLLPEIPNDKVQHIVRQRLNKFKDEVQRILDGSSASNQNRFHSEWTKLCRQFLRATAFMRPRCICEHPSDMEREVISLDDSDTESPRSHAGNKRLRETSDTPTPKRQRFNDSPIPLNFPNTPLKPLGPPQSPRPRHTIKSENRQSHWNPSPAVRNQKPESFGPFFQRYLELGFHAMSIGDIKQSIETHGRTGVPDFVSHKVREDFALDAIEPWNLPLTTFIENTFTMLRSQILSTLSSVLEKHQNTSLLKRSQDFIEEFLKKHEDQQRATLMEFYEIEKSGLFTINVDAFNQHKSEALKALRDHRRNRRLDCYVAKNFQTGRFKDDSTGTKEAAAREKFKKEITATILGPDPFERELDVAAYIRGYYDTARLRFTDSVCANMNSRYFQKIAKEIDYLLERKFELDNGDGEMICQELLEGNAATAQRRNMLKKKKQQLTEFSIGLEQLQNNSEEDALMPWCLDALVH